MIPLKQHFPSPRIPDVGRRVSEEIAALNLGEKVSPGQSVAIAVGSRGIRDILPVTLATIRTLKEIGLQPFIVPAMGSHGGATPEGQLEVLAHYGITEENLGVPIRSSMEVIEVGRSPEGIRALVDANAYRANHIVIINRVKPHTEFEGSIESGLLKMLCIGLGKQAGAQHYHQAGVDFGMETALLVGSRIVREKCPILFGVAIVENAYDETAEVRALLPGDFEEEERRLLAKAKEWMPKLPFPTADLLIVERVGKNISGTGMDTKVIGRIMSPYSDEPKSPFIRRIVVLDTTPETEGNLIGIGLADFTTRRVVDSLDRHKTYINGITAQCPEKARVPPYLETDREAIDTALQTIGLRSPSEAFVIRIKTTLDLDEVWVSEAYRDQITAREDLEVLGDPVELSFDEEGRLI